MCRSGLAVKYDRKLELGGPLEHFDRLERDSDSRCAGRAERTNVSEPQAASRAVVGQVGGDVLNDRVAPH